MTESNHKARILLPAALVVLATSCSIFETRDPDQPKPSATCWLPPELPEIVFDNMKCGLETLTSTEYSRSLNLTYTYIPNDRDRNQFPIFAGIWNQTKEQRYVEQLIGDATTVEIIWGPDTQEPNISTPQSIFYREYTILVERPQAGTGKPDTVTYRGEAEFFMREETSGWSIQTWKEVLNPGLNDVYPTSAALRNEYPP